jgi:hypothetical protein
VKFTLISAALVDFVWQLPYKNGNASATGKLPFNISHRRTSRIGVDIVWKNK